MSPFRELMTGISWAAKGERGWQWESALKNKKGRAAADCSRTRTKPPPFKCSPASVRQLLLGYEFAIWSLARSEPVDKQTNE